MRPMKRAFMETTDGKVHSELVDDSVTPTAFEVGSTYVLGAELILHPYGSVPESCDLQVLEHDHDNGYVSLSIPELPGWGVVIELHPYESEDTLMCINAAKYNPIKRPLPNCATGLPSVGASERRPRLLYVRA